MNYRSEFVKNFGELFSCDSAKKNYESHGVESMELDEKNETVTIRFNGGGQKQIDVYADSLSAIAYDIIRYGLFDERRN